MTHEENLREAYPRATAKNFRITSPPAFYNCISWVERDTGRWWEPGGIGGFYWPAELGDATDLDAYYRLFRYLGFDDCASGSLEPGVEKICIYARNRSFVHVAFQRSDGEWSSKISDNCDVRHATHDVLLEFRPRPPDSIDEVAFMKRARRDHAAAESDSGLLLPD